MIKLTAFLGLLLTVSTVSAANITCELQPFVADRDGFMMPTRGKILISTPVVEDEKKFDLTNCANSVTPLGLNLSLCAVTSNFVGGYEVSLIIKEHKQQLFTQSQAVFGTLKNNKGLIEITSHNDVLASFQQKLINAHIPNVVRFEGDSLELDEAIKKGFSKGILTHNQPVVVQIDSCQLK